MTISSAMNAGVSGLNANANKLATIADNIANSSTYGYKRAQADFYAVVVHGDATTSYSAGGVRSANMRLIDERGPLIATSNPTDLAVDGRGFLAVTTLGALNSSTRDGYPISLVTTGSFRPDEKGVLRTASGHVLMGWPADPDGNVATFPRDSASGLAPVVINNNQYVSNPTTEMKVGINLPATSTSTGSDGEPYTLTVEYFGNLGTSETLTYTFTPTVPASGLSNTWTMAISDSASDDAVVGEYTLTFDNSQDSGGRLASVTTISGDDYDDTTGAFPLAVAGGSIDVNIGRLLEPNGMTQLSDTFDPIAVSKDGSAVASLVSVEVDQNGYLRAIYDQGFTRVIYQIPVVDVPNPNGLVAGNNQTYEISNSSGPFYMWDAGNGPTGSVVGYGREESATDVAGELTQLISTQRAYSSNAKVIQTVDEMLQETTNIKR
jgi:flagellar hook protein FlgE